jgi:hypothetical protein
MLCCPIPLLLSHNKEMESPRVTMAGTMSWDVACNLLTIWVLSLGGPEFISEGHDYRLINPRDGRLSTAIECSFGPVSPGVPL